MAKFSTWLNIIFSGYSVSNCLLLSKCLDQCIVDPKSCKPKILPYLKKHIGLLKAKKRTWAGSGKNQLVKKNYKSEKHHTYVCDILNNGWRLRVSLYLLLTSKVFHLVSLGAKSAHQWMTVLCRNRHWLTAVTPTGTVGPSSCQKLPCSWSSATKLLTSPASVLCLTWLGAVWTQSSSLIPRGRCQRGLMSLPREKDLTYTVAVRQTRIFKNSRLS